MQNKNRQFGYIGLGKMGLNMVVRLLGRGYEIVVYDKNKDAVREVAEKGALTATSPLELIKHLNPPRLIWVMVPHRAVDTVFEEISPHLEKGDTLIDGGNSPYKESMRRAAELSKSGIQLLDVGVSGGPGGAREGACIMVGGQGTIFKKYESLFKDIAADDAYGYMGKSGAGHFVKMVHNGIEYGMMQSLAEGFAVMKESDFNLDLTRVADVYNHRSVIESRLVGWLKDAFEAYGEDLEDISGRVSHTGEGVWTVEAAKELGVPVSIIEEALRFRIDSEKDPSFLGKILSALRNQFGGHNVR